MERLYTVDKTVKLDPFNSSEIESKVLTAVEKSRILQNLIDTKQTL